MPLSTAELLDRVSAGGYQEVTGAKLTRWKHLRLIEGHRPGRGRGKGRSPIQWAEEVPHTVCAIASFLRTKRDLEEAALSAWLAGHPVPLATVRRLLVKTTERWLEPFPLDRVLLFSHRTMGEPPKTPGNGLADLVDQLDLHAETVADKADFLKGIPRRLRVSLVRDAIKITLGLADEEDVLQALDRISEISPELRQGIDQEFRKSDNFMRPVAPFTVATVRRVLGRASDEELLAAREAYRKSQPYLLFGILMLMVLLFVVMKDVPKGTGLMLGALVVAQNPAYSISAFLLEEEK